MNEFNKLCFELDIDPENMDLIELKKLKTFCMEMISQDLIFSGTDKQQFASYKELAVDYLQKVQPNFIQDQFNQNLSDDSKRSLIMYLVEEGYSEALRRLTLDSELLNHLQTFMFPLHIAASYGHLSTVNVLLEKKFDPRKKNASKEFPINCVLELPIVYDERLPEAKEGIFKMLYEAAPDTVENPSSDGTTVAHQMARYGFKGLLKKIITQHSNLLLMPNNAGLLPIHAAIINNQPEVVELLLKTGKASEMLDHEKRNPLHYAALYGSEEMVNICINEDIDINAVDRNGSTPLMLATQNGNISSIRVLLEHFADTFVKDFNASDAKSLAEKHNRNDIVELIQEHQASRLSMR